MHPDNPKSQAVATSTSSSSSLVIFPNRKLKLSSQAKRPSCFLLFFFNKLQSPSPHETTMWHLMPRFLLSPLCPDTTGQELLLHNESFSSLPWQALLMKTSSLPCSCASLLCCGKHIPSESNHPREPLALGIKQ